MYDTWVGENNNSLSFASHTIISIHWMVWHWISKFAEEIDRASTLVALQTLKNRNMEMFSLLRFFFITLVHPSKNIRFMNILIDSHVICIRWRNSKIIKYTSSIVTFSNLFLFCLRSLLWLLFLVQFCEIEKSFRINRYGHLKCDCIKIQTLFISSTFPVFIWFKRHFNAMRSEIENYLPNHPTLQYNLWSYCDI